MYVSVVSVSVSVLVLVSVPVPVPLPVPVPVPVLAGPRARAPVPELEFEQWAVCVQPLACSHRLQRPQPCPQQGLKLWEQLLPYTFAVCALQASFGAFSHAAALLRARLPLALHGISRTPQNRK